MAIMDRCKNCCYNIIKNESITCGTCRLSNAWFDFKEELGISINRIKKEMIKCLKYIISIHEK